LHQIKEINFIKVGIELMLVNKDEFPQVTMQQLIDHGLNAFAVQLLSESIVNKKVTEQIKFRFKNVAITIDPITQK